MPTKFIDWPRLMNSETVLLEPKMKKLFSCLWAIMSNCIRRSPCVVFTVWMMCLVGTFKSKCMKFVVMTEKIVII